MTFTKSASLKAGLCAASIMALGACASSPEPVIGMAASTPRADLGQQGYSQMRSKNYQLRPSDQISINVFREPDFSMENVRIGVEGNISMPMLGSIPAAGMTAAQLEQNVAQRLATAGLRTPMVSININEHASHLVTVEGAVESPGVYPFQPGSRLSSALAMGGGLARTAKSEQVAVFREGPDGIMVAKFDYGQMAQGTMLDPILEPSDRVVVGTDGLSVFWQDFLKSVPAFGIFATAARR